MIVSNLQNSSRVEVLHPLFKTLFDYVKSHDLLHAELGRIDIDGDNLFNECPHVTKMAKFKLPNCPTGMFWNTLCRI